PAATTRAMASAPPSERSWICAAAAKVAAAPTAAPMYPRISTAVSFVTTDGLCCAPAPGSMTSADHGAARARVNDRPSIPHKLALDAPACGDPPGARCRGRGTLRPPGPPALPV